MGLSPRQAIAAVTPGQPLPLNPLSTCSRELHSISGDNAYTENILDRCGRNNPSVLPRSESPQTSIEKVWQTCDCSSQ